MIESREAKSSGTLWTVTEGYFSAISAATASSFEAVREAKMRFLGACDAIATAVEEPIDVGLMPVMITGQFQYRNIIKQVTAIAACTGHSPFLSLMEVPRAWAASMPVVSWLKSGLDVISNDGLVVLVSLCNVRNRVWC